MSHARDEPSQRGRLLALYEPHLRLLEVPEREGIVLDRLVLRGGR